MWPRLRIALCWLSVPWLDRQCSHVEPVKPDTRAPSPRASVAAVDGSRENEGPIRIEALDSAEPPMFVLRGAPRGPEKLVFLHGMCGHGLGYAQSFARSAAKRGTLIAPQGDVSCGGPWAKWSNDVKALDQRISEAFRALGHEGPLVDVIAMGYSQGATRAETLARTFPERYTRLVVIGGPQATNPRGLHRLRGAVALAGDRDRRDLMKQSAQSLAANKVPATFFVLPEASHGSMGSRPEQSMEEVFTWLAEHQRAAP
jgi:pimeloyl-ACP methyl ester carboxylesterase